MTTPTLLKRFVAWLQKLSFRTGVVVLAMCIPCYIASFAQAVFPISMEMKGILWVIFFTIGTTLVYGSTMEKTEYKSIDNSIDIFEQLNNDITDPKMDDINDIDISSED